MPASNVFMGIEIGGTKLQIVTGDGAGNIFTCHRFRTDKERGAEGIREIIESTVRENYREKIAAAGIGFGGPVNWQTGQVAVSHQIEGWADVNLAQWLEPIAGAPVFAENDANTAALGEALCGAGKGYNLVFYITLGSGIGAGMVMNRRIYHGAIPGEAEIGHVRISRLGATLESCCSGWAVDKKIRAIIAREPEGTLAKLVGDHTSGEAAFLKAALEQKDAAAWKVFEDMVDDLAFGLSHAVHLFHPEIVVLGGGLSLLGEVFREHVEKKMPDYLMRSFYPGPRIRLAALKELAVPTGSLLLAGQNFNTVR